MLLGRRPNQLDQQLTTPEEALAALRITGADRASALADETEVLKNGLCLRWRLADDDNVVDANSSVTIPQRRSGPGPPVSKAQLGSVAPTEHVTCPTGNEPSRGAKPIFSHSEGSPGSSSFVSSGLLVPAM